MRRRSRGGRKAGGRGGGGGGAGVVECLQHVCQYCRTNVTAGVRVHCAECKNTVLCLDCFTAGRANPPHKATHHYRINFNRHDELLEEDWDINTEVAFMDALRVQGVGNWEAISKTVGRTPAMCRRHFEEIYLHHFLLCGGGRGEGGGSGGGGDGGGGGGCGGGAVRHGKRPGAAGDVTTGSSSSSSSSSSNGGSGGGAATHSRGLQVKVEGGDAAIVDTRLPNGNHQHQHQHRHQHVADARAAMADHRLAWRVEMDGDDGDDNGNGDLDADKDDPTGAAGGGLFGDQRGDDDDAAAAALAAAAPPVSGFLPKRVDFATAWDNADDELVGSIDVNERDGEMDQKLKLEILRSYHGVVQQRAVMTQFVVEHGIANPAHLDYQLQSQPAVRLKLDQALSFAARVLRPAEYRQFVSGQFNEVCLQAELNLLLAQRRRMQEEPPEEEDEEDEEEDEDEDDDEEKQQQQQQQRRRRQQQPQRQRQQHWQHQQRAQKKDSRRSRR